MPIYAYKCKKCDYEFSLYHGIDENPGRCASCATGELKRVYLPNNNIKLVPNKNDPASRVEKFIEESREVLKEQIAESRKEYKQ